MPVSRLYDGGWTATPEFAAFSAACDEVFSEPQTLFRKATIALGYTPCSYLNACEWIEERGTLRGCPDVEPEDWDALDVAARLDGRWAAPAPRPEACREATPRGLISRSLAEDLGRSFGGHDC